MGAVANKIPFATGSIIHNKGIISVYDISYQPFRIFSRKVNFFGNIFYRLKNVIYSLFL